MQNFFLLVRALCSSAANAVSCFCEAAWSSSVRWHFSSSILAITEERVVTFLSIFMPKTWLFHDVGSLGSDGSVESKMVAAIYEGIWKLALARWRIASWKPETWAGMSPPGLSCLVSHLNHEWARPSLGVFSFKKCPGLLWGCSTYNFDYQFQFNRFAKDYPGQLVLFIPYISAQL